MSEDVAEQKPSKRKFGKLAIGFMVVGGLFILYYPTRFLLSIFPPGPDIVCNRAVDGSIQQWCMEGNTNGYPNVRGESQASLALITNFTGRSAVTITTFPGFGRMIRRT